MAISISFTVFVFLMTTATVSNGTLQVLCEKSERQALLRFKQDLKDPMNRLFNWDVDEKDCCRWSGVVCDNLTGHVHELHLGFFPYEDHKAEAGYFQPQLGGKINPSLLNLKYLNYLDLSYNNFEGLQIPHFIGSLKSLTYLNLSEAGFGGTIPQQLGNLSNLCYLDLSGYDLKVENLQWMSGLYLLKHLEMNSVNLSQAFDLMQVLNMLPSLTNLRLSDCELHKFAPFPIINSTSLVTLDLSSNQLGPLIPKWIFSLSNLVSLNLGSNNFEGWPTSFSLTNMTRLKILGMSGNSFNSITFQSICSLNRLESLDFSFNKLEGNIPSCIGNLTSIISLDLSANQLEEKVPKSLGNLCRLKELQLSLNKFSGAASEIFEGLSGCAANSLESLALTDNQFSGQLTNKLGQFRNLVTFSAHQNLISGPIPLSIGKLTNLQGFDVSYNRLNGSLPKSFGQLVKLEQLDISHNMLEGVVSEFHFINLTRLRVFYASENSLTLRTSPNWLPPFQLHTLLLNSWHLGAIPHWIRWQKHLLHLEISNTGISDTIPSWFCSISSRLHYLNLSLNQFHGEFPCTTYSLSTIDLSSNHFNGSLPLASSKLRFLDFSKNSFSGSVFHFFCDKIDEQSWFDENGTYFRDTYLYMGNNLLSGVIPNCWTKWKYLRVLYLENNNLVGDIPSSMRHLVYLTSLHLRNNSLSGELPLSLQECTSLTFLDLRENNFTGKIPGWIGTSFSKLVILNLRSNRFHGHIPLEVCNLVNLRILDLAHNNLSGTIPTCLDKLNAMITLGDLTAFFSSFYSMGDTYQMEDVILVTKGREVEYKSVINFVASMDLSCNNLFGEIPMEITKLLHLESLNLSQNHLIGKIPSGIGDMKWLESLDLSKNQLSGEIPSSISSLTFISHLNLSYNNFTGRIPTSTQLQSLEESSFIGNQLCGPPLDQNCSIMEGIPNEEQGGQSHGYLYLSLGLGFAFGFWGVLGSLLLNTAWSIACCRLLDRIVLKLCDVIFYN